MNNRCPQCGHEIEDGDDFCTNCGYKLDHGNGSDNNPRNESAPKQKPLKKMKVLEESSSDLRKEELKKIWTKKPFWIAVAIVAVVFLVAKSMA